MAVWKPAKFYTVCDIHGTKDHSGKGQLSVSKPNTRKQRRGGCPICAQLKKT